MIMILILQYYYIYKIIEEKFYWESKDLIDLESETQRKDNYMNYYLLFKEYLKKCNLK